MWLDRNQFPADESLVVWSPTSTQVKNHSSLTGQAQSCLTGLHLPWVLPLRPTSLGNHYLGMGSTGPLWVSTAGPGHGTLIDRGITVVRIFFLLLPFYVSLLLLEALKVLTIYSLEKLYYRYNLLQCL
jgi:hypothetical protein